ncbi:hypothetical protein HAX54_017776 [Datura stramonium]|uniref:Uncharacterized protein n=1 Tax=Datura stramonium TaxID=4076 RepID=A0ABS8UMT9_DATST|nr:hypothetical protein [Datura stramonium]
MLEKSGRVKYRLHVRLADRKCELRVVLPVMDHRGVHGLPPSGGFNVATRRKYQFIFLILEWGSPANGTSLPAYPHPH